MSCTMFIWKHSLSRGFQSRFLLEGGTSRLRGLTCLSTILPSVKHGTLRPRESALLPLQGGEISFQSVKTVSDEGGLRSAQEALGNTQCVSEIRENLKKAKAPRASVTYTLTEVVL